MSEHRMFSNRIANSAKFLQMPAESQLLYFHMILRADDDGVVEAYPLMKLLGSAPDVFKVLIAKGFIRQLNEDQVVVIPDWLEHNTIRADRKVNSIYYNLLKENYPDLRLIESKPRSDVEDNSRRLQVDGPRTAEVKLSKVKIREDNTNTSIGDSQSCHQGTDSPVHSKETHIKETHSKDSVSSNFKEFYTAYPRKVARASAEKVFRKCEASLLPEMLKAIEKHKNTEQWQKDNGKFIPYPATWLNQRRWEDEVKEKPPITLEEEARELVKQCECEYGENGATIAMQRFQAKHFPNNDQGILKYYSIFKI